MWSGISLSDLNLKDNLNLKDKFQGFLSTLSILYLTVKGQLSAVISHFFPVVINSSDAILYAFFLPFPLVVTVTTHITKPTRNAFHYMPQSKCKTSRAQTILAYCFGSNIFYLVSVSAGRVGLGRDWQDCIFCFHLKLPWSSFIHPPAAWTGKERCGAVLRALQLWAVTVCSILLLLSWTIGIA